MTAHFSMIEEISSLLEIRPDLKLSDKPNNAYSSIPAHPLPSTSSSSSTSTTTKDLEENRSGIEYMALPEIILDDVHTQLLMNFLLHCSDISNPCKPWAVSQRWSLLIFDEFMLQGDKEKEQGLTVSPNRDRLTTISSQLCLNFIDFIVAPIFVCLCDFMEGGTFMVDHLKVNRGRWDEKRNRELEEKTNKQALAFAQRQRVKGENREDKPAVLRLSPSADSLLQVADAGGVPPVHQITQEELEALVSEKQRWAKRNTTFEAMVRTIVAREEAGEEQQEEEEVFAYDNNNNSNEHNGAVDGAKLRLSHASAASNPPQQQQYRASAGTHGELLMGGGGGGGDGAAVTLATRSGGSLALSRLPPSHMNVMQFNKQQMINLPLNNNGIRPRTGTGDAFSRSSRTGTMVHDRLASFMNSNSIHSASSPNLTAPATTGGQPRLVRKSQAIPSTNRKSHIAVLLAESTNMQKRKSSKM